MGGDPEGRASAARFRGCQDEMPVAQEEMFGPIAPIIKVSGESECVADRERDPVRPLAQYTRDTAAVLRLRWAFRPE